MAYQRLCDLIEHVGSFHEKLRHAVEGSSVAGNERSALLLDYIAAHERFLKKALDPSAPESDPGILETWLQFTPNVELEKSIDSLELESLDDVEELVVRVLEAEDGIVRLFSLLEANCGAPRVRAFFASLREMGDGARRRYARAQLESLEG